VGPRRNWRILAIVSDDHRIHKSICDLPASACPAPQPSDSAIEIQNTDKLEFSGCLITDVHMPGMDGWKLQRLVETRFSALPTIVVTAHQEAMARQRALEMEAIGPIARPLGGRELPRAVDAAISHAYNESNHV